MLTQQVPGCHWCHYYQPSFCTSYINLFPDMVIVKEYYMSFLQHNLSLYKWKTSAISNPICSSSFQHEHPLVSNMNFKYFQFIHPSASYPFIQAAFSETYKNYLLLHSNSRLLTCTSSRDSRFHLAGELQSIFQIYIWYSYFLFHFLMLSSHPWIRFIVFFVLKGHFEKPRLF